MSDHDARVRELNERARKQYEQDLTEANERVEAFYTTVTQREWLLLQRQLDASREQIGNDQGLTLLGYAWINQKRDHGGASWDRLLDMTDDELLAETHFPTAPDPITEVPTGPELNVATEVPVVPGSPVEVPQTSEPLVTGS